MSHTHRREARSSDDGRNSTRCRSSRRGAGELFKSCSSCRGHDRSPQQPVVQQGKTKTRVLGQQAFVRPHVVPWNELRSSGELQVFASRQRPCMMYIISCSYVCGSPVSDDIELASSFALTPSGTKSNWKGLLKATCSVPGVEVVTWSAAVVVGLRRVSPFTMQGPRDEKSFTGLVSGSEDQEDNGIREAGRRRSALVSEIDREHRGLTDMAPSNSIRTWRFGSKAVLDAFITCGWLLTPRMTSLMVGYIGEKKTGLEPDCTRRDTARRFFPNLPSKAPPTPSP